MNGTSRRNRRLAVVLWAAFLLPNGTFAQQKYATEIYQDLRGRPPIVPELHLSGPDLDSEAKFEEAGLRITFSRTRPANQSVQLVANFVLTGDFEITGTYDLLAADMPTDGYGVGISINVATGHDLRKFVKVSRVMRPKTGSVFMAEYWTKGANDWKGPQLPTEVRSGQLRLVRDGAKVRCQVSEGPGKEFSTIFEKETFGTDDLTLLRYEVTDGNKPGYAVDARLVDLRIRYSDGESAKAASDLVIVPVKEERKADSGGKLALLLALGMMLTLALAIALGLFFYLRRGTQKSPDLDTDPSAALATTFACTACGKSLQVKSASAGKRVKCPKCGQAVVVPREDGGEA